MEQDRCSFCGKGRDEVGRLINGPRIFICNICVLESLRTMEASTSGRDAAPSDGTFASQPPSCSLCGRREPEAGHVTVNASGYCLCDGCRSSMSLSCSFCGKSQREVRQIVAGPKDYICDECIGLCLDILAVSQPTDQAP
jgi:hypothetical protein